MSEYRRDIEEAMSHGDYDRAAELAEAAYREAIQRIAAWDHADVEDLAEMLRQAEQASRDYAAITGGQLPDVDWTSLPSEDIPDDVDTTYPVWSQDRQGRLLVGTCADDLEALPLTEYRARREE